MAEGFLGRWSQRKQAVRTGQPVAEPAPAAPAAAVPDSSQEPAPAPALAAPETAEVPAPPTLEEAQALTPQSDFRRFVATDVDPEVKHVAMRQLFSDPHFNVMDGLDIYIDDYNKPDPLPAPMLRKLASAQFLGLVEEEKPALAEPRPLPPPPAEPGLPSEEAMAAGPVVAPAPEPDETQHHDDPDLRLQQDHAPGPQGPGHGA